jgi:anti-sigma factor (TIGR02949 family)
MKCHEVYPMLSGYLDGALSPSAAKRIHAHLERCPGCHGELDLLRRTVRLVGQCGLEKCPVDLRGGVLQKITHAQPEPRWSIAQVRWTVFGGAAASMAALIVAAGIGRFEQPQSAALQAHPAPARPAVHQQFHLASGLGAADGLMLAVSPDGGRGEDGGIGGPEPRLNASESEE